jgi:hypothetical protein
VCRHQLTHEKTSDHWAQNVAQLFSNSFHQHVNQPWDHLEAAGEIDDIRGHETATGLKITAGFLYIFWDGLWSINVTEKWTN